MDTEFWRQLKTPVEDQTLLQRSAKKKHKSKRAFRDLVFRLLMPGVFLFMACYHVFVYTPESAKFYLRLYYH